MLLLERIDLQVSGLFPQIFRSQYNMGLLLLLNDTFSSLNIGSQKLQIKLSFSHGRLGLAQSLMQG